MGARGDANIKRKPVSRNPSTPLVNKAFPAVLSLLKQYS
jgi:hypothetical protein